MFRLKKDEIIHELSITNNITENGGFHRIHMNYFY